MAVRAMLVGVSGGAATNGATEIACRFAARFGADLEALHVRTDIAELAIAGGAEGLAAPMLDAAWLNGIEANERSRAEQIRMAFRATAARHGFDATAKPEPGAPSISWREEVGDAPAVVARRARFFDLAVLGRSDRLVGKDHTDTIEETLIQSGRPVLIAPADPPAVIGETIALGWNGSDQAVRALVAALPFLKQARETCVIAIGDAHQESAETMRGYLRIHGIDARVRGVTGASTMAAGGQLLSAAQEERADLLVMGGYGHTPWREMLFGGATHQVVKSSLLPLIIAH